MAAFHERQSSRCAWSLLDTFAISMLTRDKNRGGWWWTPDRGDVRKDDRKKFVHWPLMGTARSGLGCSSPVGRVSDS